MLFLQVLGKHPLQNIKSVFWPLYIAGSKQRILPTHRSTEHVHAESTALGNKKEHLATYSSWSLTQTLSTFRVAWQRLEWEDTQHQSIVLNTVRASSKYCSAKRSWRQSFKNEWLGESLVPLCIPFSLFLNVIRLAGTKMGDTAQRRSQPRPPIRQIQTIPLTTPIL